MSFFAGAVIAKAILDTTKWVAGGKQMQTSMGKMGGAFQTIGKLAAGAGLAIGAAIAASVVKTNEWNKELANVSTLVDTSSVDIKAMGEEILALDPRLGTATELTKGLYQALSASVEPADAVRAVGESAKFAKAALIDTNTAVDVGTTLINAYGQTSEQITPAFDKLFTVIKLGKTTGAELSSVIGQSIPLAANMGISFDELGASIAIMTRQGIKASEATTQFNAIVNAFLKPSTDMKETLEEIGFESGSAAIESLGFKGALDKVLKSTKGNKEAVAGLFKNTRALRGVMALTGEGAKDFNDVLEEMENSTGATAEAFEKQELTFDALMGTIDRLMIQVGQAFLPAVFDIVESLTEFTQKLADNESFMNFLTFAAQVLSTGLQILGDIVLFVAEPLGKMVEFFGDAVVRGRKLNTVVADNADEILSLSKKLDELNKIENKNAETKEDIEKVTARLIELLPDSEEGFLAEAAAVKASVEQLARRELILKNEELKAQLLQKIKVLEKDIAKAEKDLLKSQKALNTEVESGNTLFQNFSEAELEVLRASGDMNEEIEKGPALVRQYQHQIDKAADRVDNLKTNLDNTKTTLQNVKDALINLTNINNSTGDSFQKTADDAKKEEDAIKGIDKALTDLSQNQSQLLTLRQQGELLYFDWRKEKEEELAELKEELHQQELDRLEETIEKYQGIADTIQGYLQPVLETFGEALAEGELTWESLADVAKETIAKILVALGTEATARAAMAFATLNFVGGALWSAAAVLAFVGAGFVRGLQTGGSVYSNEPVIVGETGPELFIPDTAGQVYSNGDTNNMLGRNTTINNYNTIKNPADAELYSRKLADKLNNSRRII